MQNTPSLDTITSTDAPAQSDREVVLWAMSTFTSVSILLGAIAKSDDFDQLKERANESALLLAMAGLRTVLHLEATTSDDDEQPEDGEVVEANDQQVIKWAARGFPMISHALVAASELETFEEAKQAVAALSAAAGAAALKMAGYLDGAEASITVRH